MHSALRMTAVAVLCALPLGHAFGQAADAKPSCEADPASQQAIPVALPSGLSYANAPAPVATLDVQVDAQGHAVSAAVVAPTLDLRLAHAAVEAAQRWTYRCLGDAEPRSARVTVRFSQQLCALNLETKFRNPPVYPPKAFKQRQQGEVVLEMRPRLPDLSSESRVATSSGYPLLDAAALVAAAHWRFQCPDPLPADGNTWIKVPVRFAQ